MFVEGMRKLLHMRIYHYLGEFGSFFKTMILPPPILYMGGNFEPFLFFKVVLQFSVKK